MSYVIECKHQDGTLSTHGLDWLDIGNAEKAADSVAVMFPDAQVYVRKATVMDWAKAKDVEMGL